MELDVLKKVLVHECRPLVANLHTLLKAIGLERHLIQDAKMMKLYTLKRP